MFKVTFTGSRVVIGNTTGDHDETGWIDPEWSMFALYSDAEDVRTKEFDTRAEALEFIDETIGATVVNMAGGDSFYAQDTSEDPRSGDTFFYAGHIEEV